MADHMQRLCARVLDQNVVLFSLVDILEKKNFPSKEEEVEKLKKNINERSQEIKELRATTVTKAKEFRSSFNEILGRFKSITVKEDNLVVKLNSEKEIVAPRNEFLEFNERSLEDIGSGSWEQSMKEDDNLFDAFHAVKDGDVYRVTKDLINFYEKCDDDRIYTQAEFEQLENEVMDYFRNLDHFAQYLQWEDYHEIQFNLSTNSKLYNFLLELAQEGNVYVLDFLIFDALEMAQYKDSEFRAKAEQYYYMVPEPSVLPLNHVYRAILFGEYSELVKEYRRNKLFSCWYEWNLDTRILLTEIRKQNITFEDESDQMMLWLLGTCV